MSDCGNVQKVFVPSKDDDNEDLKPIQGIEISDIAAEHYGVEKLEDLIEKNVCVFRRFRDEHDEYEMPFKFYLQKATIVEFIRTFQLNMAEAVIRSEGETETEAVKIQRVCIDWEA